MHTSLLKSLTLMPTFEVLRIITAPSRVTLSLLNRCLMLFKDEEVTDGVKPQFAGHIMVVVEHMPGQLFSGTLGLLRPPSAATKERLNAESVKVTVVTSLGNRSSAPRLFGSSPSINVSPSSLPPHRYPHRAGTH